MYRFLAACAGIRGICVDCSAERPAFIIPMQEPSGLDLVQLARVGGFGWETHGNDRMTLKTD